MQYFGNLWVISIEISKFASDMKKMNWAAIALMMATAMTAGCSSSSDENDPQPVVCPVEPPTTLELTRAEQEMVNSSNAFAFNLFREARDEVKSQILSPISITYALGMLNNGAAGETQQEINKVLGFAQTGAAGINEFCYKMLQRAANTEDPLVLIANNIYMNKGFELLPEFVSKAKTFYNADAETRDFHDGKTRDAINQWGSDHTKGMIKEVLKKDEFNPDFVSYLLNAIYFKGTWTYKFDKNMTVDEVFGHAGDTEELTYRPMMHQQALFGYAETDDYQALRLPYGKTSDNQSNVNDCSFVMTVLLPKLQTNALPEVPTTDVWQQIQQQMSITDVDVKLPRFESDTDIDLIPIMKKLGMNKAFSGAAEFPYFCDVNTYIALMKQVAKIKLDEEGTEAAAVTVIGMDKSAPAYDNAVFHADHPFIYVISEQRTGAIFFIGQYTGYQTGTTFYVGPYTD